MPGAHVDSQEMAHLIEENLSAKSTDFIGFDEAACTPAMDRRQHVLDVARSEQEIAVLP